jgi:hypothetical protein
MKSLFKIQSINIFIMLILLCSANSFTAQQNKVDAKIEKFSIDELRSQPDIVPKYILSELYDEIRRNDIARFYSLKSLNSMEPGSRTVTPDAIHQFYNDKIKSILDSFGLLEFEESFVSSEQYLEFKRNLFTKYHKIIDSGQSTIPKRYYNHSIFNIH